MREILHEQRFCKNLMRTHVRVLIATFEWTAELREIVHRNVVNRLTMGTTGRSFRLPVISTQDGAFSLTHTHEGRKLQSEVSLRRNRTRTSQGGPFLECDIGISELQEKSTSFMYGGASACQVSNSFPIEFWWCQVSNAFPTFS